MILIINFQKLLIDSLTSLNTFTTFSLTYLQSHKCLFFWWKTLSDLWYSFRFFKECPHPDENQRRQLSRELGLDPKQIKFWFQNKRTQKKVLYCVYILQYIFSNSRILIVSRFILHLRFSNFREYVAGSEWESW